MTDIYDRPQVTPVNRTALNRMVGILDKVTLDDLHSANWETLRAFENVCRNWAEVAETEMRERSRRG